MERLPLNKDTLISILLDLNHKDLLSACQTNRQFRNICHDQRFWKLKIINDFEESILEVQPNMFHPLDEYILEDGLVDYRSFYFDMVNKYWKQIFIGIVLDYPTIKGIEGIWINKDDTITSILNRYKDIFYDYDFKNIFEIELSTPNLITQFYPYDDDTGKYVDIDILDRQFNKSLRYRFPKWKKLVIQSRRLGDISSDILRYGMIYYAPDLDNKLRSQT